MARHGSAVLHAVALLATLVCGAAQAGEGTRAEPVAIAHVIPYADTVSAPRFAACDWNAQLSRRIVADADGRVVATQSDFAQVPGSTLEITVTQMQVGGFGRHIGKQSWILLHGELRMAGRTIDTFDLRRGGFFRQPACATAREIGKLLSADVVGWLDSRASATP
jgi:hypothetical protein